MQIERNFLLPRLCFCFCGGAHLRGQKPGGEDELNFVD